MLEDNERIIIFECSVHYNLYDNIGGEINPWWVDISVLICYFQYLIKVKYFTKQIELSGGSLWKNEY